MRTLLALLLLAPLLIAPADAQQIRRCTAADGSVVMTDKPCAAIGAADRVPPQAGIIAGSRPYRGSCMRTIDELSFEISAAIDLNDANRLAGVYHWVGANSQSAQAVMGRLQTIVDRPLLDIGPAVSQPVDNEPTWKEDEHGHLVPVYPKPRAPHGIRLVQAIGKGGQSTSQTFGLRRHMGCLWISF